MTITSQGFWPGNEGVVWYDAYGVCKLGNEEGKGQRFYQKHRVHEILGGTRSSVSLEMEMEAKSSWWAWLKVSAVRNWEYALHGTTDGGYEVFERDDVDVHFDYDGADNLLDCCWFNPPLVHDYCVAKLANQSPRNETGVDGSNVVSTGFFGGPVGLPFSGPTCPTDQYELRMEGEEIDLYAHHDAFFERLPGWEGGRPFFNPNILARAQKPPGYKDPRFLHLHVDGDGKLKRIDYMALSDPDDLTSARELVWYEVVSEFVSSVPGNIDDLLELPVRINTRAKCESGGGGSGPLWLALLAASALLGAILCTLCYANGLLNRGEDIFESLGFGKSEPGDADATLVAPPKRMSQGSGMDRPPVQDNMSQGSGMTRGGTDDKMSQGSGMTRDNPSADNRLTQASGMTRPEDAPDTSRFTQFSNLTRTPTKFEDEESSGVSQASGKQRKSSTSSAGSKGPKSSKGRRRSGSGKSVKSSGSRHSTGSRQSKASRGSRRSTGSQVSKVSKGSRHSASGGARHGKKKSHKKV